MPSLTTITTAPDLTFDALVAGEAGAPLVLLLHGFAESMQCWRAQVTALFEAFERRLDEIDRRLEQVDRRLDALEAQADMTASKQRRVWLITSYAA